MTKHQAVPSKPAAVAPRAEPPPQHVRRRASRPIDESVEIEPVPETPFAEGVHSEIDQDLRHRLVSETAYRHYVERGYCDGGDLDDWLQAEAEVDHCLLNRPQP
ncbi:MAG: DUF2934 domain-containing protein [Betaproteobacteria bacterium]|jgi:hypothetical protein|nr:DUF2934 domain-containing protein [Betaproteobacteria bacterium]MDH5287255.1 DUF2934 domain-containing protein [Betaproteobacteria bacterium]